MLPFPTIILRHRKENLKKCTLRGLESREDMQFYTYPKDDIPSLKNYLTLSFFGPPLTKEDQNFGLFIIDGSWRYAERMEKVIGRNHILTYRSLPKEFQTAYPRKQPDCPLPQRGLASIEALFLAYHILGRDTTGILDHYYWKDEFLSLNLTGIMLK